jgi:tetratricopeptide (TPR) repeat protein
MRLFAILAAACVCLAAQQPARVTVDYPLEGSVFPPDFAAPTFLWRDAVNTNTAWRVEVEFSSGAAALRLDARGDWMQVGEIDYRATAETNEIPKLSVQQAGTRTWRPDAATWETIKKHSVEKPATITFVGFNGLEPDRVTSRGSVRITTSKDPVGAPIFFRDVPLMPAQLERGVIKPLPKSALPLVAWRLRYVSEDKSRTLVEDLPTCMNCHSFSRDGKTLGLDLDGPQNDKGLYALVPIHRETVIRNQDVIAWSAFRGKLGGKIRVGFMSQVSPDGQTAVTMVNGSEFDRRQPAAGAGTQPELPPDVQANFYVANFKDYRFLQVFYPTRGILAWYNRRTGKLEPLPGADDVRYVHTNATWSPDGKHLVFARAEARDAYPPGSKLAERANDPNETQIQYDLYRIPFNEGRGGQAEPIPGASNNGMSNSFPKISPDGKWIVFTQARNGLLMRPDGQLYIVPFEGGQARKMSCNTPLMNSWHSFSPNGRWLAFSSKQRSPYTQMYLTHIDEDGNDTPAILVENATAANRAVNIPEFVNVGMDGWLKIDAPATEFYRLSDNALEFYRKGEYEKSIEEWKKALALDPNDAAAVSNLGAALNGAGRLEEAAAQFRRAFEIDPENARAHSNMGIALARGKKYEEAAKFFERAIELRPSDAEARSAYGGMLVEMGRLEEAAVHLKMALGINPESSDALNNLGGALAKAGKFDEAVGHFQKALELEPNSVEVHYNLGRALAARGDLAGGIKHLEQAARVTDGREPMILEKLAAMYAEAGRFADASAAARRGMEGAERRQDRALAESLKSRIAEYESKGGRGK